MPASTKLVGIAALLLVLCDVAAAFAPGAALQPTNRLGLRAAQPVSRRLSRPAVARLSMQEGGEPLYEDDSDAMVAQKMAQKSSKQGGISDGMRAKLLKENQVLGGDPDAPSINFAVVVGTFIAGLAVVGTLFGAFGN
ncbi:hypothetical protein T484DRAFT_1963320 [Baffinella frigidus]|nr:hypothetical protein T484DRAFT_1963320 [Cryptophyta sp. CCMP2293]